MSNVIAFPTSHARIAARRTGAGDDELEEVADRIEAIVAEINRIIDAENRELDRILKEWSNG